MKFLLAFTIMTGIGISFGAQAQTSQATGTVTATCKDGTTFSGTTRSGACRGHGGVQAFAPATTAPTASPPAAVPSTSAQTGKTPAPPSPASSAAGQVWVNTSSKVYHCSGDRYYGKTKHGTYMTEAAARAQGDRPDHGKACS